MVKFTVIIGPAPGGVGVNLRQDGDSADLTEEFWRLHLGNAIKAAMRSGTEQLKTAGILTGTVEREGEAARIAGEQRHGAPGEAGGN